MSGEGPRLGFIGLGDIGSPMAERLLAATGELIVWNRSPEKADALVQRGAVLAVSPAQLLASCDLIGVCLTSHQAVEEIVFGSQAFSGGAATEKRRVIADFSTGAPQAARRFAERARQAGCGWIDIPVSGGVPAAKEGRLILFAGGTKSDIEAATPLFSPLSARLSHMGPSGAGQTVKLCNQMIVACNMLVMAETIAIARKAGVDVAALPHALKGGFADSLPLQLFGPRMAAHRFEPRLGSIALMEKDLGLALGMARETGLNSPVGELCSDLYRQIHSRADMSVNADISSIIALYETFGDEIGE